MRRRRQVLQVSTFPFLAVLLCAMGSLILLLLVIDRRAKVVMRAKALEAIRQMETEEEKAVADREAEWERRRHDLHEKLQNQMQELDSKEASLEHQLTEISRDLQTEQARGPVLDHELQDAKANLIRQEKTMTARILETAQKKQQSEATQAELMKLTADLVRMEQTLADLKTLRQRQQQTYSLVPYRGRRGDNRRPIYLECASGSLIFHPDRWTIPATDASASAILQEVERRINRHQATGDTDTQKKETPYLLLLVRPDGIVTYYRTLSALRNLQVDFGYEFVEPDWILSFPEDEKAGGSQPWMATGPLREPAHFDRVARPETDPKARAESNWRALPDSAKGVESMDGLSRPSLRSLRATNLKAVASGLSDSPGGPASGGSGHAGGSATAIDDQAHGSTSGMMDHAGDLASGASNRPGFRARFASESGPLTDSSFSSAPSGTSGSFGDRDKIGGGFDATRTIGELPTAQSGDGTSAHPGSFLASPKPPALSQGASGVTLGMARPRGVRFAGASGSDSTTMGRASDRSGELGNSPIAGSETAGSLPRSSSRTPGPDGVTNRGDNSPRSPDNGPDLFGHDPIGQRASMPSGNGTPNIFAKNDPDSTGSGSGSPGPAFGRSAQTISDIPNGTPQTGAPSLQTLSLIPSFGSSSPDASGRGSPASTSQTPGGGDGNSPNSRKTNSANESHIGSGGSPRPTNGGGTEETGPQIPGSGLSQLEASREKKPEPSTIVRRYVRPEWNIFVECKADQAVVYPGGLQISMTSQATSGKPADQPLFQTVQQMIARRKALMASSDANQEAATQAPQIRFLVRPDGLRTYFLAFPELTPLQLPMTRENLDVGEDVIRHMVNR